MKSAELDYELPPELIAQRPLEPRDSSRLLVYDRATGAVRHRRFDELPEELAEGMLVVVNDTRVVPARLRLERPGGGEAEVLLLERLGANGLWEGLARPSRRLKAGQRLGPVELVESLGEGRWRLRLEGEPAGEAPLPPYIKEQLADPERYQTVYAEEEGSAAAPTAGLHFTPELLGRLDVERVTLHVGLDTFRPISADDLAAHELHSERYAVSPEAWARIEAAPRVLAVGTTTVRVLESIARGAPLAGRTESVRDAGLRVSAGERAADELPPPALDASGPRDGVRRSRGDAPPVPARDRGALPLLLVRRRDADPVTGEPGTYRHRFRHGPRHRHARIPAVRSQRERGWPAIPTQGGGLRGT